MALENRWLGYVTRTFQQAKTEIIIIMGQRVPEFTDFTEGHILTEVLDVYLGVMEMLGYYIDNRAREAFLPTNRLFESAINHAKQMDYATKGRIPATVNLTFTIDPQQGSDITIPAGTEVSNGDGISFFTDEVATLLANTDDIGVGAIQKVPVTGVALGNSDGTPAQSFDLGNTIANGTIAAKVNAISWTPVDSLAFSLNIDEDYIQRLNALSNYTLEFGDDINGLIPPTGQAITVDYGTTSGADGNLIPNTITTIVSAVTVPGGTLTVTNEFNSTGGSATETLESIQKRAPLSVKTQYRAVNPQDYIDVLILADGVEQAGIGEPCGRKLDAFIIPIGGGIAPAPLIASTQIWIDDRKITGRFVTVQSGGQVDMIYEIDINVVPGNANATVEAAARANMLAFHDPSNQTIQGSVALGDIFEIIENTPGVVNSEVLIMTTRSFARPLSHLEVLDWAPVTQSGSTTTVRWTVQAVDGSNYQLFKEDQFVGTFAWGADVERLEVNFNITFDAYTPGNKWEFYTYAFFGTVNLAEPSIAALDTLDLTLNMSGGV